MRQITFVNVIMPHAGELLVDHPVWVLEDDAPALLELAEQLGLPAKQGDQRIGFLTREQALAYIRKHAAEREVMPSDRR